MKIAITGGTGFVGSHLAESLVDKGHEVVLISRGLDHRNKRLAALPRTQFKPVGTDDEESLRAAFDGCGAVAHCAGINREVNEHDYQRVHVDGTRRVVSAAKQAGVGRIAIVSFYRARPDCGSPYHESKFAAEEIVRSSDLDYTVFKAGMIYGKGDHMLDHLSHIFHTLPFFALVGFSERSAAPLAIADFVRLMEAALVDGKLSRQTVAVLGPEKMTLGEAVRRVARVVGREPFIFRMPIFFHYGFATFLESIMTIPLVSVAQVRILTEGFDEPYGNCQALPDELQPTVMFTDEQIRAGLPEPGAFGWKDLRCGK